MMDDYRKVVAAKQRPRVVFLQPEGPQIPERVENEPGNESRVLEGDGEGQEGKFADEGGRDEENPSLLQRKSTPWSSHGLGHA